MENTIGILVLLIIVLSILLIIAIVWLLGWKRKHDEAIKAWCTESNSKDEQILKLQEELKTYKDDVDTKEILRHLDSMMICIGNAYDTSHYLLESDMEFIEKQEKIIKELISNANKEESK